MGQTVVHLVTHCSSDIDWRRTCANRSNSQTSFPVRTTSKWSVSDKVAKYTRNEICGTAVLVEMGQVHGRSDMSDRFMRCRRRYRSLRFPAFAEIGLRLTTYINSPSEAT